MFQEITDFVFLSRVGELFVSGLLGFGLAVLLQSYIKKNSYIPLYVGWILVVTTILIYAFAFYVVYGLRFL